MKRMIALLLLLCTLTACASGAPEAADPPEMPAEAAPKEEPAARGGCHGGHGHLFPGGAGAAGLHRGRWRL